MLNFLGVGSAFTRAHKNTSAYYFITNSELLLIDVGETVFHEMLHQSLFNSLKELYILITHFHSDHIGSLGSLLFYCEYLGIKTTIIYPNIESLEKLLSMFGIDSKLHVLLKPEECKKISVKEIKQQHSNMEAYGYLINIEQKLIYYSGDTKIIPISVKEKLDKIDFFYQDVRQGAYPHHMSFEELAASIKPEFRKKVYCMHIPDGDNKELLIEKGFKIAEEIKTDVRKRIK